MFILGFLAGVYSVGGLAIVATLATSRTVTLADYRREAARFGCPLPVLFAALFLASPVLLIRSVMR